MTRMLLTVIRIAILNGVRRSDNNSSDFDNGVDSGGDNR